jgi:UDPglucose 6-dehydrogenase
MVLIGECDKKSGDILEKFYEQYCMNKPAIRRMNIVNAEITKISIYTYITSKISFANTLSRLCDKLPGGAVDVVTNAMGQDTRIGVKYLKGGLGYGGPCFPRDNRALNFLCKKNNINHLLASATDETNFDQIKFIINKITTKIKKSDTVAILGLSYKPNTPVIEESQSIDIIKALLKKGCKVTVYDPEAMPNTKKELGNRITYAKSMQDCVKEKNAVCLCTEWKEFNSLKPADLKKGATIIDCWRSLNRNKFEKNCNYIALGVNNTVSNKVIISL